MAKLQDGLKQFRDGTRSSLANLSKLKKTFRGREAFKEMGRHKGLRAGLIITLAVIAIPLLVVLITKLPPLDPTKEGPSKELGRGVIKGTEISKAELRKALEAGPGPNEAGAFTKEGRALTRNWFPPDEYGPASSLHYQLERNRPYTKADLEALGLEPLRKDVPDIQKINNEAMAKFFSQLP